MIAKSVMEVSQQNIKHYVEQCLPSWIGSLYLQALYTSKE